MESTHLALQTCHLTRLSNSPLATLKKSFGHTSHHLDQSFNSSRKLEICMDESGYLCSPKRTNIAFKRPQWPSPILLAFQALLRSTYTSAWSPFSQALCLHTCISFGGGSFCCWSCSSLSSGSPVPGASSSSEKASSCSQSSPYRGKRKDKSALSTNDKATSCSQSSPYRKRAKLRPASSLARGGKRKKVKYRTFPRLPSPHLLPRLSRARTLSHVQFAPRCR